MPELKCTVQTCVHNNDFLCSLDRIQVGGETAKSAGETSCDSFQERKEGSYANSLEMASDCACVDCKATECMYNESCKCQAGRRRRQDKQRYRVCYFQVLLIGLQKKSGTEKRMKSGCPARILFWLFIDYRTGIAL